MATKKQLRAIAPLGGVATLKKHGKKHYSAMVKKRWENAKKLKAAKK